MIELNDASGKRTVYCFLQPTKTFFGAGTPAEGEEDFIATVMMNDAFWGRILASQN